MSNVAYLNNLYKSLTKLTVGGKQTMFQNVLFFKQTMNFNFSCVYGLSCRHFHITSPRNKVEDRRKMLASLPAKDEGTEGERAVAIDSIKSREDMFPCEDTPNMLFNGIPFKDVPVCHIRVTPNNTIISLADGKTGAVKVIRSCGVEGFKNTRKGTNVAAQATAITFSSIVLEKGYKTVRVAVRGLGPGRMSAIKGLQMGGLDIISVSDTTRVSENPPRPPRPKSL